MHPTIIDTEMEIQHDGKTFTAALGKPVDDVKIIGVKHSVTKIVAELEKVFGKCTSSVRDGQVSDFVNCGVRHQRLPNGDISMDQDEYLVALKPTRSDELRTEESNEACSVELQGLFGNLLGAVAYSLLTHSWISCFVISLQ